MRWIPRAWLGLSLACATPAACAYGTGVYWSFVNRTTQAITLTPAPADDPICWEGSTLQPRVVVPAGLTATYYLEVDCTDTEFDVDVQGGGFDGSRVGLWIGAPAPHPIAPTRNVRTSFSRKRMLEAGVGTSNRYMTTNLEFTGEGVNDTLRVGTGFQEGSGPLPPGSYRATCNADFTPATGMLTTDCLAGGGAVVRDQVLGYPRACAPGSSVSNLAGAPVCDEYAAAVARGSYLRSCRVIDFDALSGMLVASCADDAGTPRTRSLQTYYACEVGSTLSNVHGQLACDRPFRPAGPYLSQCTHVDYADGVLQADCRSFVPLPGRRLDYQQACAPWSTVRLDLSDNQLACDTPKRASR